MSRLTTEYVARVYDDDHGFYVEIGKDADGIDLCDLTYSDGDSEAVPITFSLSWEHAARMADAIKAIYALKTATTPEDGGA